MMIILVVAALMAGSTEATPQADLAAANMWVSLVDAKHWDESWNAAGTLFRSRAARPRWRSAIQPVREALGPVTTRSLQSITKSTSLPGAPDGDYEVVQFQTSFAHKASATETIVLAHEVSGWKVDGYFIR